MVIFNGTEVRDDGQILRGECLFDRFSFLHDLLLVNRWLLNVILNVTAHNLIFHHDRQLLDFCLFLFIYSVRDGKY